MGETTVQPTNPAAEQKNEQKGRHASTLIAVASAVTAVVAAVLSGLQVNLASSEHADAERQQLVSLTTLIATQYAQLTDSNVTTVVAELTVEGQAGTELIRELHGDGVTGTEYSEIGAALEKSGYTAQAITYYKHAVDVSRHEAETHAEALRYLAGAYYSLPRPELGHQAYMQAAKVYSGGHVVEPPDYIANNIAQAYLLDAEEQLDYTCRIAHTELKVAQNTMAHTGANPVVKYYLNAVPKEYKSKCGGKV
jgi:tetratricopeptide (TPR) repeat protein